VGAKLGSGGGPMAEINVTPLIDVVLVLLVVFMVITPMLQSGQQVDLPIATQSTTVNDVGQHITISITPDRGWWVEQNEVTEETLIDQVNYEYRINPERSLLVKADKNMPYGDVRKALDILAENRITTIFIATNKEG
jgi:biopolymer transport protein TolR